MTGYENWDLSSSEKGELINNLIIVDKIVGAAGCGIVPEFHILGGAALVLNGVNYKSTLDIDTANKITDVVKEEISPFIDDAASEVVILPTHYLSRLIPFGEEMFSDIKVFILSNEDLVFTKLTTNRRKDIDQLRTTNIFTFVDKTLLFRIIDEECSDTATKDVALWKLKELGINR